MGTIITLNLGNLEISCEKNEFYESFRDLFKPEDWKDINYYYCDNITKVQKGYSRKLSLVKPRLELLGFTLKNIREIYENNYYEYCGYMDEYDKYILTYDEFFELFTNIDLSKADKSSENCSQNFTEYIGNCTFEDSKLKDLAEKYTYYCSNHPFGEFYNTLPTRLFIRILCENPSTKNLSLQWHVFDHIENGWAEETDFTPRLEDKDKILIVTEGKSDTYIIRTSIAALFPEISDFFYFIDMHENYPFTGTGNLTNFYEGLIKIRPQNKIIIIFDNDYFGISAYNKCRKKPNDIPNLKLYHLPDLPEFKEFLTVGPTGEAYQDVNGKAVAIECFLDLLYESDMPPKVEWSSCKQQNNQPQGALLAKEKYTKNFKKYFYNEKYNKDKLIFLINDIINFWCND